MNRRSFLKGMLGSAAVVAAPTLFIPKTFSPTWRSADDPRCPHCGFQRSIHFDGDFSGCQNLVKSADHGRPIPERVDEPVLKKRLTWQSWEDVGMGIGNVGAVRKLEMYHGMAKTAGGLSVPSGALVV